MRDAGARQLVEHGKPVGFEPGDIALPEGRGGREREQVRQEISGLAEEIDAELVVVDADMDVHAADDEAPHHLLQILSKDVVALFVGVLLARPLGERMGRGGDGSEAELAGDSAHGRAQADQIGARLLDRAADLGADFDLRAQEFRADLAWQRLLAFGEEGRRRFLREVARLLVDEEIFLLHADGEARFANGHQRSPPSSRPVR